MAGAFSFQEEAAPLCRAMSNAQPTNRQELLSAEIAVRLISYLSHRTESTVWTRILRQEQVAIETVVRDGLNKYLTELVEHIHHEIEIVEVIGNPIRDRKSWLKEKAEEL